MSSWIVNDGMSLKIAANGMISPQEIGKKGCHSKKKLGGLQGKMQTSKDLPKNQKHLRIRSPESPNRGYGGTVSDALSPQVHPALHSHSPGQRQNRTPSRCVHRTMAERPREKPRNCKPATAIMPGATLTRSNADHTSGSSTEVYHPQGTANQCPPSDFVIRKKWPYPSPVELPTQTESDSKISPAPANQQSFSETPLHIARSSRQPRQRRARSRVTEKTTKKPEIILIDDDDDEEERLEEEKVQPIMELCRRSGVHLDSSSLKVAEFVFGSKALELPLHMVFIGTEHFEYADSSKKCQLVIDKGDWFLRIPDKWPRLGALPPTGELQHRQLELDTDLITNIICGWKLSPDQFNIAFIALQMDPAVSLSLPVRRFLPNEEMNGSGFCPEIREDMSPYRYILLVASDEVVETLVNYIGKKHQMQNKLDDLSTRDESDLAMCWPYLAAYFRHVQDKENQAEVGKDCISSKRLARRAKKHLVVYDDEEASRALFRYPMEENAADTITICVGDVRRLTEGEFLNDNLIDLQVKRTVLETGNMRAGQQEGAVLTVNYADAIGKTARSGSPLLAAAANHKSLPVYAFSSMFYSKLTEVADRGQAYALVQRWTKNVDIFSKDFVFIPINIGAHWSLTCVVRPGALMTDEERSGQMPSAVTRNSVAAAHKTCILIMDSLGLHSHRKIGNTVTDYLIQELRHKKQITRAVDKKSIPVINCRNIPKQENSYDCGVYVTLYAKMICDTYPSSTQTDIENKFANHFSKLTFSQIDVDAERARIRLFCEESRAQWQVVKKQRALQELERKGKRRRECGMVTEDICEDRGEVADCDFVLLHSGEGMGQPRADVQENCCDKTITTVDAEDGLSLSSESEAEEIEGGKMVDVTISKQSLQRETSAATRTTDCRDKENFTAGRKSPSREDLLERILRQRSLLAVEVSRPSFDSCSDDGGDQSAIDSSSNGSPDESAMASCDMGTKRSNVVMLSPVQHGGGSSNACRAEWSSSSRQNAGPEIQCIEPHRFYNT